MGVTSSRISQLIEGDVELQALIGREVAKVTSMDIANEVTLANIEKNLLNKVANLIEDSDSLGEATAALSRVVDIKHKKALQGMGRAEEGTKVEVNLSHIGEAIISISFDSQNRVEAINDRVMASMPYDGVMGILQPPKEPDKAKQEEPSDESRGERGEDEGGRQTSPRNLAEDNEARAAEAL